MPCVIPITIISFEKIRRASSTSIDHTTRITVRIVKYTAPKNDGLEYITPILPKFAVMLYKNATASIKREPLSDTIAFIGSVKYCPGLKYRLYVPPTTQAIPTAPHTVTLSPNIIHEVRMRRSGVNAKNGNVRYIGEICNARIYNTSATTSSGGENINAYIMRWSIAGIPLMRAIAHNTGKEKNMRPAATVTG